MKFLGRLFHKPPPTAATLNERIATPDTGPADLMVDTVFDSADEALRIAAVLKLPDGEVLRRLAGLSGATAGAPIAFPASLARAAHTRLAQLIDEGSIDFSRFFDPTHVAQLVVESPSSRLRQLAAEAVDDPAQLKQLLKQVRNKDKNVYRILKHKCDALNAEEREAAQIATEVGALCESLERHSQRRYDALYTAAFEHLAARWRSLTNAPPENIEKRAVQAIDRCREVIAEHGRQAAQQAAQLAAQRAARESDERAHQAAREAASAAADAEARLRKEAASLREAEETARASKRAAEEQILRQIGGLIRNANGALNDGNTQGAAGLRRAIDHKLSAGPALPSHLTRVLQQLDGRLNELKQWKDYAVAPKRAALIEEMEALSGSMEKPKVLADRIKSLQAEWRTISKGIVSEATADWERFHQASQAAYQPCREYFDAQTELRKEHLERRKVLLERLAAFEKAQNGETADWRLFATVLREAPQEWRQYFPVDRQAGRAVQGEFDAAITRLQAKLDGWHERNAQDKQSLIKRARQALDQEDGHEAIEAVKRLQTLWKEAGPASRDQDQALWGEFRELCDAVYKKRQQAYSEYVAGLEANRGKALALCEEAERAAAVSGVDSLEGGAKIREWRAAFDALGEMPRADARGLHGRFERALDLCAAQVAQQHARDEQQSFTNLIDAGRHVQAFGWAVARNAQASECEVLRQAAETFFAGIHRWPKGGLEALEDTLAKAGSPADADVEACEKAMRILCIRCEIHSETPTPPEDEALRREYQGQRLIRGMGQGNRPDEWDWDSTVLEWIRIGAVSPAIYESLRGRLMRCKAKNPAHNAKRSAFA